jgi:hypothetical protein
MLWITACNHGFEVKSYYKLYRLESIVLFPEIFLEG